MSEPARHPMEDRLFRLCIVLKVAFWLTLLAVLARVLWATAMGSHPGDPVLLIGSVAGMAMLQFAAAGLWWRARSHTR